ncbi:hypothetical protein [Streptomyces sp. NBC_00370]|uniref:hypothetical protein n=1 Tax=Streptomyces sp. NBC_00370 TaxID=2975728 RepID=UPI002E275E7B
MDMDEELLRGRIYGEDHDHPRPGPKPGRTYAEFVGGPLDGLLLDITGWTADEIPTGVALMTELGQFGAGGRARYELMAQAAAELREAVTPPAPTVR